MDWKLFAQLLATLLTAALGWQVAHHFAARRDLYNERRKLRVTYLIEAYRRLEGASNREDLKLHLQNLESALADIQLLGSPLQVRLVREFALRFSENHTAPLDELIFDLRQSLRTELELELLADKIVYLRITG